MLDEMEPHQVMVAVLLVGVVLGLGVQVPMAMVIREEELQETVVIMHRLMLRFIHHM